MLLKINDSLIGKAFVHAHLVYWREGKLIVCTSERDAHFACRRRDWEAIQFWMWLGCFYIDITRLKLVDGDL